MKKLFFVFVLLLFAFSCKESKVRNTLDQVESIIEEYPDSAKTLLNTLDKNLLSSKNDAADYSLYNSMIVIRSTGFGTASDSLIMPAVEYYRNGPANKKIRSLYYLSAIKIRSGESEDGLLLLEEARELAEEEDDYLYIGKCSQLFGEYYRIKGYFSDAERAYNEAIENYVKVGYHKPEKYLYGTLGSVANTLDSYDKALDLVQKSIALCTEEDKTQLISNYWHLVYIYANKEDYNTARYYAELAIKESPALNLKNNVKYAQLLYKTNNVHTKAVIDSVKYYIDRALSMAKTHRDTCVIYELNSIIQADEGNYKEAYLNLSKSFKYAFVRLNSKQDVSPGIVQRKYYEAKARHEAKMYYSEKIKNWGLVLGFLIFVGGIVYFYRKTRRKNEERIKYYENLSNDLSHQLNEQSLSLEELKTKMRGIYRSQFQKIGDLIEALHISRNREEETYIRRRVSEVTAEFSTTESQRMLEDRLNSEIDNIMTHVREDFPNLKERDYLFIAYMIIGFDATIVSIILDMSLNAVYSKKSRLKDRLFTVDSPYQELYKRWIS